MRKVIATPDGSVTIKSNGRERELLALWQLPAGIAESEFDYVDSDPAGTEFATPRFFQFRGSWYDVNDGFERTNSHGHYADWDGIQTQSYFDAVLIRYAREDNGELNVDYVVVGYTHW